MMKAGCVLFLVAAALIHEATASGDPIELTATVRPPITKGARQPVFLITFRNRSESDKSDFLLYAGFLLSDQREGWTSLTATLLDAKGHTVPFVLGRRISAIAGRIYPLFVPLPAGSAFDLLIPSSHYYTEKDGLSAGPYTITFHFSSKDAPRDPAAEFPPYWKGEIHSEPLTFTVPKSAPGVLTPDELSFLENGTWVSQDCKVQYRADGTSRVEMPGGRTEIGKWHAVGRSLVQTEGRATFTSEVLFIDEQNLKLTYDGGGEGLNYWRSP